MARYKLLIEYDGKDYAGWQRQKNAPSIQQALEEAVVAFCGEVATVQGAGRTDAGVHAIGMIAHVDIEKPTNAATVQDALNFHLSPAPVSILDVHAVSDEFHARFSCVARHYVYKIINRRAPLSLDAGRAWRIGTPLDDKAMHKAAQYLKGKHDFTTFRASICQAQSPVKTLDFIEVQRNGALIEMRCHAPSFLHNQVRSFAGSLIEVGKGRWAPDKIRQILSAKQRSACGQVAPPDGLYFVQADYPPVGYKSKTA